VERWIYLRKLKQKNNQAMAKLLEKALTDAIKERKHTLGTTQVVSSMKYSKLVVISQSVSTEIAKKIHQEGFKTVQLDISEFEKADGGLTCLSIILKQI